MTRREYLNFDLTLETVGEDVHRAAVTSSPAGETSTTFEIPFSPLEIENFLLRVGRPRRGVRRIDSPEMYAAQTFGSRLYEKVFAGEVGTAYRRSLDAAEREGKGLRLRLRLTGAPDLGDLPWEYLYSEGLGDFLVLSDRRPMVRYPELPVSVRPLLVEPPLRILLLVSAPSDYPALDAAAEEARLRDALAGVIADGRAELRVLERATLSELQRALRQEDVHILHYIGHGGFDRANDEGVLVLEDDQGRGRMVSGRSLGTILHDHDPMRLLVLNACEGPRTGTEDPFGGVAPELTRRGAPAVVAMQFEITDGAAIQFAREFYLALADGYPVDAAVSAARKAIFAGGNDIEWGTPVLYLRAPSGEVFEMAPSIRGDPARAGTASTNTGPARTRAIPGTTAGTTRACTAGSRARTSAGASSQTGARASRARAGASFPSRSRCRPCPNSPTPPWRQPKPSRPPCSGLSMPSPGATGAQRSAIMRQSSEPTRAGSTRPPPWSAPRGGSSPRSCWPRRWISSPTAAWPRPRSDGIGWSRLPRKWSTTTCGRRRWRRRRSRQRGPRSVRRGFRPRPRRAAGSDRCSWVWPWRRRPSSGSSCSTRETKGAGVTRRWAAGGR